MVKASGTDWKRLAKTDDAQIDTSDVPELGDDFFNAPNCTFRRNRP